MQNQELHSESLTLSLTANWQRLRRRLLVLLGLILPLLVLIITYGLWAFLPGWGESWLFFAGGMVLLGVTITLTADHFLKHYRDQIAATIMPPDSRLTEPIPLHQPAQANQRSPGGNTGLASDVFNLTSSLERLKISEVAVQALSEPQAEGALRESEARYQQLLEFSPEGVVLHSEDKIAFVNSAAVKILGAATSQQLVGKSIVAFAPAPEQQAFEARLTQTGAANLPPFHQSLVRLDNREIEAEIRVVPFSDEGGTALHLIIRDETERKRAELEIAQRTRELTVLQAAGVAITSRLDLRYVLDTVVQEMAQLLLMESCAIFEWDQTRNRTVKMAQYGSYGWWDPASKPELYDLAEYPLTKSVLEDQISEQMTISRHDIDPFEFAYMRDAGLKTVLMLPMIFQRRVLGLVKLEDSRVERTFTYQEISLAKLLASQAASAIENARLYDQLRQRVAELTVLNEISHAITSTLDLQEMLTIINKHIIQLLNVVTSAVILYDEVEQNLWFAAVSGEAAERMLGKRLALGESVVGWVVEHGETIHVPNVSKDARFVENFSRNWGFTDRAVLCVPLQAKGKTIGAIEVIRGEAEDFEQAEVRLLESVAAPAATAIDNARLFEQAQDEISERLRAEAALEEERALLAQRVKERTAELSKANAELARASRLKDEFLAGMSHELRTPLNGILGSAEILQTGTFGELNERQRKYTRNIDESGRHLLALINDILDLSKVEAGKLELDVGPVSIESVCQASLRLIKELAHKKKLTVKSAFNHTITIIQADERRIKQILVNLLSNAIKFTPEEREIGLEVSEDMEKQVVHFTVWDTGIGIPKEDLIRLFQPFVQLDSSLARQHAGTGLGLSLVSRMVELHGGGISVESEVGHGSRFMVSLPFSKATAIFRNGDSQPEAVKPTAAAERKRSLTGPQPLILLTDDNEDNINMILEFLEAQNYRVITARNGAEAIARTVADKPDVVLMDIQMPGMDGLEATRRLRTDVGLVHLPIIALTALAMPGDRERCLAAGANEYLSKPVSPVELVNKIEGFLNSIETSQETASVAAEN